MFSSCQAVFQRVTARIVSAPRHFRHAGVGRHIRHSGHHAAAHPPAAAPSPAACMRGPGDLPEGPAATHLGPVAPPAGKAGASSAVAGLPGPAASGSAILLAGSVTAGGLLAGSALAGGAVAAGLALGMALGSGGAGRSSDVASAGLSAGEQPLLAASATSGGVILPDSALPVPVAASVPSGALLSPAGGGSQRADSDTSPAPVTSIPEPASLALLGIGVAGLAVTRIARYRRTK